LFSLGSFLKIREVAQTFRLHELILTENGWGYILDDFFHKLIWSPCTEARKGREIDCLPLPTKIKTAFSCLEFEGPTVWRVVDETTENV
jgi:hypothetical protein